MTIIYTLLGVPYVAVIDPVRGVVLQKAARKRIPSPGQMSLFGSNDPKEGDTKVENGVTYRLNQHSRWERTDKAKGTAKAKPKAVVPVVEEKREEPTPEPTPVAAEPAKAEVRPKAPSKKSDIRTLIDLIEVRHLYTEPTEINKDALDKMPVVRDYLMGAGLMTMQNGNAFLMPGSKTPLPSFVVKDFPGIAQTNKEAMIHAQEKTKESAEKADQEQKQKEARNRYQVEKGEKFGDFYQSIIDAANAAIRDGNNVYSATNARHTQLYEGALELGPNKSSIRFKGDTLTDEQVRGIFLQVQDYRDESVPIPAGDLIFDSLAPQPTPVAAEVVVDEPKPKQRLGDRMRAIAQELRQETEAQKQYTARMLGAAAQLAQNQDNLIDEVVDMVNEDLDTPEALPEPTIGDMLAEQKAEEEAGGMKELTELSALKGSEKQIAWAEKIRSFLITEMERVYAIDEKLLATNIESAQKDFRRQPKVDRLTANLAKSKQIIDFAKKQSSASWWIERRNYMPEAMSFEHDFDRAQKISKGG